MTRYLGVDIGTSGARALIVDEEGRGVASASCPVALQTPAPGWAEQDPDEWVRAAEKAIADAVERAGSAGEIAALGLTGQMHSVVFLDREDRPLRPAILWCDQRTAVECEEITEAVGGLPGLLDATLNRALPGFTAPKIPWVRKHEPEVLERCERVLVAKDYVRYVWTGEAACDVSDASGTLLLDVRGRSWSEVMTRTLEVPESWLPRVVESNQVVGHLKPEVAARVGLPAGLPVVAGAGDQAAGALGCGLVRPGSISVSLGTSGVVFGVCDRPLLDEEGALHSFAHAVPGMWHAMGVVLSAGGAVQWFRNSIRGAGAGPDYHQLDEEAATVPAGAEGLLFLPYLTGERTPILDPDARGTFAGLHLRHGRGHLMRAVLEGVCFALADCLDLLASRGLEAREIRVTGGGARSDLFLSILASAMGAPLRRLQLDEGPAMGAAILAASANSDAAGVIERADAWVQTADEVGFDEGDHRLYGDVRARYRALYQALRPLTSGDSQDR